MTVEKARLIITQRGVKLDEPASKELETKKRGKKSKSGSEGWNLAGADLRGVDLKGTSLLACQGLTVEMLLVAKNPLEAVNLNPTLRARLALALLKAVKP